MMVRTVRGWIPVASQVFGDAVFGSKCSYSFRFKKPVEASTGSIFLPDNGMSARFRDAGRLLSCRFAPVLAFASFSMTK